MNEFDLIRRWFRAIGSARDDVIVGVGDDAAVLAVPPGQQIVVTTDTLVAGRHFPESADPFDIGHKTLAVSLSDLAAMGAQPAWATLSAALPSIDEAWIERFCRGLDALAARHDVALVGGDTVRGPVLTLTLQLIGLVPAGRALCRSGAQEGDAVMVTGTLGDAAAGLGAVNGTYELPADDAAALVARLHRPQPRVAAGPRLRGLATAAIDISDGLLADLEHVLDASGVGAVIDVEALPLSDAYRRHLSRFGYALALSGGDDYELAFTAHPESLKRVAATLTEADVGCTRIGTITAQPGLRLRDGSGQVRDADGARGFDHFAS